MRRLPSQPRNHCVRPIGARVARRIAVAEHGGDWTRLSHSALRVRTLSRAWLSVLAGSSGGGRPALASARFVCEEGFGVTKTKQVYAFGREARGSSAVIGQAWRRQHGGI